MEAKNSPLNFDRKGDAINSQNLKRCFCIPFQDSKSFPGISSSSNTVFQFPFVNYELNSEEERLSIKSFDMEHSNLAEIKVSYSTKVKFSELSIVTSSKDAEKIFRIFFKDSMEIKEEFYLLILTRALKVKGWYKVSEGGMSGTVVDPKIIFSVALKSLASAIMIAHNHPSGNTKPSEADLAITRKLKEGGKLLEIQVLDHLILTSESYYSFADEGIF